MSQKDEVIPSIHSPGLATTPSRGQNDITDSANKPNGVNSKPRLSDAELYPDVQESPRTPSYLKISSAVSGYGHYSKYSAYTGIEKRSPYSSTLSLRSSRSDLTTPVTPDMPIGKIPNIQPPTNYPPLNSQFNSQKQAEQYVKKEDNYVNGHTITNGAIEPQLNGENGHLPLVGNFSTTGDSVKDADYFLQVTQSEENRLQSLCSLCEIELLNESLSEEASGRLRAAVGKANLLINQKFRQFQDLCQQHKHPEEGGKRTKWEDLQGFWEMVKIQVDDVDEMFTEIELLRQNGWREIKALSRRSSSSSRSSPKSQSGSVSVSNTSTPSHTPGSKRKGIKIKDTPESSPERTQKAKMAARAREEARKKMLAEKRAAMKQQKLQNDNIEIYVADSSKSNTPEEGTPERTQSREGSNEREPSEEKEGTPDLGTSVDTNNGGTSV